MNKIYQVILFDLDGTLTDPMIGITKSVQYALKHFGIEEHRLENLTQFIGPPLHESFMVYYQFDEEKATEAVSYYREYFSVTGLYENEVYPGISKLLEKLASKSRKMIVATSKPTVFAETILKHFKLSQYFDYIAGSNLDGTRVKKSEVITFALEEMGLKPNDNIVMIGDRMHDVIGAREVGIDSIGVLYGYGSSEEHKACQPTYIAESIHDLSKLLLD